MTPQEKEPPSLDLSDDEDLAQAFDMHSLIVSSLHPEEEDKVLTADEVISEIDDMMKVRPFLCSRLSKGTFCVNIVLFSFLFT